jgi:DNA-binding winged helix-turn-helix (wHTH) protein
MTTENNLNIARLQVTTFISGDLTVNFSQNRVSFQHHDLILQPKVLELLVLLCAAQGQTLSKQELTAALWPDTIVGPDSLANTVTRLRKALNDNAKQPAFIETVQRKGYRWLQDVSLVNAESSTKNNDESAGHIPLNQSSIKQLKIPATIMAIAVTTLSAWELYTFFQSPVEKQSIQKFPFPDLHIERLPEGGYEIQVGIDGELTEERKAAMLKEIKRITGEEHSDMIFTLDPIEPDCEEGQEESESGDKEKATCKPKPL